MNHRYANYILSAMLDCADQSDQLWLLVHLMK